MSLTHTDFLREAVRLSRENVERNAGGPFGAVIVRNGEIVGRGANAVTAINDPTAHAEIVAIRRACSKLATFELRGCILYSSCEPCPMCLTAAYWARVDAIYYAATQDDAESVGFDDAFLYRELGLTPGDRSLPLTLVPECEEDAREVFRLWAEAEKRVSY